MTFINQKSIISILLVILTILGVHAVGDAEITAVSDRTPEVRDAIVAAVSGINDASDVTETHLAGITNLNLRTKGITELKLGDFSGLTGLANLNLYNNELSSLPDGIFEGLTALTTLRLGKNTVDPLPVSVSLEKVGEDQFKAVAPTGAPFAIVLPISVTSGSISDSATTLTIAKGSVESSTLTVTRTAGTTDAVTANIGTLPSLPRNHYGYVLSKSDTLPLTIIDVAEIDDPDTPTVDPVDPPVVTPPVVTPPPAEETAAPVFIDGTLTIRNIAENTAADTNIGAAVAATDANSSDTLTWTLGGVDAASFSIVSTTGQLQTKAALDYEMKRVYVVTITVSDGSLTDTISVIISIIDVNDTPLDSMIVPVSERTPQVRDAIVAAVPGVTDAADVTDTHLAAITSLNLRNKSISELKIGDFSGLSGLTSLNLYGNMLSSLPSGVFSGLTSLTTLRLGGNTFDPMPLIVSLQQVSVNQYQAVITSGAPFDVVVPIDDGTMITIQKGSLTSGSFTYVGTPSIGSLPVLPPNHFGYVLSKSTVCNRTLQILEAITAAVPGVTDCRNVSDVQLATITNLDLNSKGITALNSDDFARMLSLIMLDLSNNQLSSLPDGIFSGLTGLTTLSLDGNTVDPLPLTVSLEKVGTNQIKAVIPTGAPFDMMLPISVANGSLDGDVNSITIPSGSVESMAITVIRTANTFAPVTADIGSMPSLPIGHTGYSLVKSDALPIEVFNRINVAPVFTDGTSTTRSIAENTASGENIGTAISATDADDDTLTYSLGGTDASAFAIDTKSGQLKTSAALDYESKTSYSVTITVSDGSLNDTINVTINVTDVDEKPAADGTITTREPDTTPTNNAPEFTDGDSTTRSVAENTGSGVDIGSAVAATDADGHSLTYTLSGTDAASFNIDSTTGQLRTSASLDYETKSSYSITITVSDGNLTDMIDVTINITDVDERPANTAPEFTAGTSTTRSVAENTGSGVDIGAAVSATDADNDTLTYGLIGTDAASFNIDSTTGQLRTSASLDYETESSYSVTITVSDGNGGSDSISVTINVSDVDETPTNNAPEFSTSSATRTVAENTGSGEDIGAAFSATDEDDDTLSYTLGGTDALSFSIDSTSGQLQTSASLDYESKSSYSVSVTASDGSLTDSISVTINVTDVNEAPEFSDGVSTTRAIAENVPENINIGSAVSASDPEGSKLTYTLGGTDAASFSIDTTTGQLKTKATLDYETKTSYSVTITVSDGSLTDTITVTINVTNLDETPSNTPPAFTDGTSTTRSVAENTAADSNIGTPIAATDADKNTLAYLLSGEDASSFSIVSTTGQLKTNAALNHEDKLSYTVVVTVTDGSGTDSITVTINVTDVNEAPVIAANTETTLTVPENTAAGVNIGGTVSATDPDVDDELTYSLGGTDAASFSIVDTSGQLQTKSALDFETKASYTVTITVSDGTLTDSVDITINVSDVDENRAPVFTDGDSTTREVAENTGSGVDIGSAVAATDADDDDLTYTLGGTDAASFSINSTNGQLRTKSALDFETKTSYSVMITVSDGNGGEDNITVTINVSDVDENRAPVFTDGESTTREIAENTGSGVDIGSAVAATDADNDDLTYTLGGTDASSFSINSTNGQLRTKSALDFETKNSYSVTITVTDEKLTDTITVTIQVTDVDENRAPVFTDGANTTREVDENTAAGENIGDPVAATDEDSIDTLTYTLGGTDASSFDIVSTTGQLQTKSDLDYETKTSYAVTISVSDGNGKSDTIDVTINVTNVDENQAPVFAQDSISRSILIDSNTAAGDNIGAPITATDADNDTLSYSVGGTDASFFSIVSTTGQLQTTASFLSDTKTNYVITVIADDGNGGTDSVDVTVRAAGRTSQQVINSAPVFTDGDSTTRSIAENTAAGQNIGDPIAATDTDTSDTLTYTLGGTDTASFSIVSTSGQLQTKATLDFETKSSYSVTVSVSDGSGGTDSITVTINVTEEEDSTTITPVSDRTAAVRDAIVAAIEGVDDAADVTEEHLAAITLMRLNKKSISSLKSGDFSGMTSLTHLHLQDNSLTSLPEDIFDGLSSLLKLYLEKNDLTSLPEDIFDGLSSVDNLWIAENDLTSLPEDIFDGMSSLRHLHLEDNDITGLPADIFDGLSSLWALDLENNEITDVSAVEDLTSLAILSLAGNMISDYTPLRNLLEANPDIIIDITIPADPDAPVFSDGASTTRSVAENTAAGENIGSAVAATDTTANDTLTYTLSGTDKDSFSIVSTSGQLQTKAALDYETKKSYSVTITVTDLTSKTDTITVTINVTNISEISPAISARTSQVQTAIIAAIEGVDNADDVTDIQLAAITHLNLNNKSISSLQTGDFAGMSSLRHLDLSGNSISSLPSGVFDDLSSIFNLNLKNNSISDVSELEDLTSLVFLFLAGNSISDYGPLRRLKANSQVGIDITIPPTGNQAPLFTGRPIVGRLIAENTAAGVLVGTITATDADGDDLTYTFGGKDADSFTFESETAKIKTKAALDYETKRLYVVTVSVSDGNGGTDTITVHITVTNVSEISPAISARTSQVQTAIIAAINGVDNADDVIDTQLAAITELGLNSKSISSLKTGDFAGMSLLEEIYLQDNSISSLPEDIFDSLSSLEVIRLRNNSISSLPEDVFDGLSSLEELQLGNNSISSLPEDVFDGLSSLEDLWLESNSISSLAEDVFDGLSSLEFIRLNDNSISSLPEDVFDGLSALETIELKNNSISSLAEDVFDGLSSLELCILEGNSISSVPEDVFDGLSALTNINLKDNSVTSLNEDVFDGLSKLTHLHLQNNGLTSLPEDIFDGLSALTFLYLEDNSLSSLSEDIFDGLSSLETISLDGNSLTSLSSDVFDGLSALNRLYLEDNDLTSLPSDVFDGLSSLTLLHLADNDLTSLPSDVFDDLTSLRFLYLTNNSITDVSEVEGLTSLSFLYLDGNSISDYGPLRRLIAAIEAIEDRLGLTLDITIPEENSGGAPSAQSAPDTTALLSNYPNPFNPETWIPYKLAKPSDVRITIYDIRGNVVRRLDIGHQRAGFYTNRSRAAHWDGKNKLGEKVAAGVYFYQLQADTTTSPLRKMVILK